ncbi:MAG: RQC domain-containing protein [Thermoguttaceae bacterium]|jgi:hypothetical protein
MVLSGVARTQARFPCGKNVIAQMLCGSTSAKMAKLKLDRLSTFGLLRHLKQTDVVLLIDVLIAAGCLEQVDLDRFRPVVRLTDLGNDVMRGRTELASPLAIPSDLAGRLLGNAPKQSRPVLPSPLAGTPHGSRPTPHASDNDQPLPSPLAATPHAPRPTPPAPRLPPPSAAQPSHYWTWRLLSAGFSPAECAAIRGIPPEVVLDHALRAAESGWLIRPEWRQERSAER